MTDIQQRSSDLLIKIYENDYYIRCLHGALEQHHLTNVDIFSGNVVDDKLVSLWNTMWNLLPDNKNIRRTPFFEICDLCEGSE